MQGDGALTVALDPAVEAAITDPAFVASNQKSSINGALQNVAFCMLRHLEPTSGVCYAPCFLRNILKSALYKPWWCSDLHVRALCGLKLSG